LAKRSFPSGFSQQAKIEIEHFPCINFADSRVNRGPACRTGEGTYKLHIADSDAGEVAFFGTIREAGLPAILALRLKIENRKISEIETIVARQPSGATSLAFHLVRLPTEQ
jgi:hypothetical protein